MLKPVVLLALFISLVPSFAHAAPAKCPVINGTFAMVKELDGRNKRITFSLSTRIANGVFSYTVNKKGDFQSADGVARPLFIGEREGRIRLSCEDGVLKEEMWALDDHEETAHLLTSYSVLNSKEVLRESNNPVLSGVYTKQD